ncbi:trichohyalin-like [Ylistrum balloti]|uniref:trichohyalin-like n=1 Tax=Ylistrum balloti TaxID=509963 RepID=UPI002905ABB1|nr:trichohyalin-like [Ylistrum balloti]
MAYISTYPISASDVCVPVKLEYESSELTVNEPWIFGAFFLGLVVGIGITALLVPCCLRSMAKKQIHFLSCLWRRKAQDEEELLEEKAVHVTKGNQDVIYAYNVRDQQTKKTKFGKKKGKKGKRGDEDDEDDEMGADNDIEKPPLDPSFCHGIGDILVQNTIEGAEAEMSKQDVDKVDRVTRDLRREKDDMFLKQLKMQLRRMKVGDVGLQEIVNNVMEDLLSKAKMYQDEKQEVEDETRRQMAKDKNPGAVQTEVDKLDSQLEQKLVKLHEDERDFIRQELSKRTDLKDEEIEAIMAALLKDMANLEKKLGLEFHRQNRLLEERLARRRQILEFRKLQDQQSKEELKDNVQVMEEAVKDLVNNKDVSSKEATQLINQYMLDLQKLHSQHEKESNRQLEDLSDKLRSRRMKRLNQLQNKHERERAIHKEKRERGTDAADFSQGYHDLLQKQRTETEITETEIDQQELETIEIDHLTGKLSSDEAIQVSMRTEKIRQQLEGFGQDSRKAEQIIDLHKARMDQLNEKRMDERNLMASKVNERWEKKMQQLDEQEQQSFVEKETMNEQQNQTVNRVLSTSVELTDEAKKKIIREHQHNMEVLNNQLDKSKIRQQRNIEYQLNERRAKMAALRKQREDAMANKAKASKEEMEKLEKQLEEEIALEQENIEKERQAALLSLRQRLATETEEALAQGEQELSVLIGRLEVGSARRKLVLQKQDTMLQSLQEQLENKLSKGGVQLSGADQIIQQHNNQVDHLNQQLQACREDQEYNIREKIQAMKLQKESELERELQEKIVVENQQKRGGSIRRRGASKASEVLSTLYMQQKHKREINQLEEDMKLELERSKEELNRQLQQELEAELKNQKQQFITQLAATSGMSREDILDTVDSANMGGSKKQARKLAKELKDGMQRAKTDLAMDQYIDEQETRPSSRLSRPGSGRPQSGSTDGGFRPKSGLKKKGKRSSVAPAKESWGTENYTLYNEDDF